MDSRVEAPAWSRCVILLCYDGISHAAWFYCVVVLPPLQESNYREGSPEPSYSSAASYAAPAVTHVTASQVSPGGGLSEGYCVQRGLVHCDDGMDM